MTAVTSRRRVPTVALWGALGVLAWAVMVALFGGGVAHASDREAPHDRPVAAAGQKSAEATSAERRTTVRSDHGAPHATDRAEPRSAPHDRQASKTQDRAHHAVRDATPKAQAPVQRTTTQKAPVQKATAQKATAPTEKTHRTAKATAAHRSTVQTSAKQFAYDAEFESADPARLFSAPATGTFEGQRETGERDELRVAQYGFSSFTAAQDDDGDHRAETFSVMGAMTTTTTWASTSTRSWSTSPKSWSTEAKNAFRGASHHAHRGDRHHSRDDRSDNGRHRGHDRFVAAGHGQHRAAPAPVVRAEHGTSNAVASSWTRAVVGHHADVTAVAAPSTAPSDADAPAPSDDTSADTAFPAPFTPAAPSTTTASGGSTPIAVAAGVTDEMPIHEGTPVHAAEATQSVVPLAPVFTTDVSPD